MYIPRATGGLEEDGKGIEGGFVRRAWFFLENIHRNDTCLTGIEGGGKGGGICCV